MGDAYTDESHVAGGTQRTWGVLPSEQPKERSAVDTIHELVTLCEITNGYLEGAIGKPSTLDTKFLQQHVDYTFERLRRVTKIYPRVEAKNADSPGRDR